MWVRRPKQFCCAYSKMTIKRQNADVHSDASSDSDAYDVTPMDEHASRLAEALSSTAPKPVGSWSCLKFPSSIVPEAFDSQEHRVPRQLAAVTGLPLHLVLKTLDEVLEPGWRENHGFAVEDIEAFAKKRGAGLYVFHGGRLIRSSASDAKSDCRAIVGSYWSGRWYFHRGVCNQAKAMAVHEARAAPAHAVLAKSLRRPHKEEPFEDEFPWDVATADLASVPPGRYWVYSCDGPHTDEEDEGHTIEGALKLFIASGRYPLISWVRYPQKVGRPQDKPHTLTYHKTAYDGEGQEGIITIKTVAQDARQNCEWARKLQVPYHGQSIGAFASIVLDTLLQRRRRQGVSDELKRAVLRRQSHKCAGCEDELEEPEFDHAVPLCKGGTNEASNINALCGQCHSSKTRSEGVPALGYLKSRFNREVFEKYVASPSPPCMVFRDAGVEEQAMTSTRIAKHLAVDVIGSRRNALYQASELPVFTPLDDLEPVTPEKPLPDLVYVDRPQNASTLAEILATLPYHGPGFYSRVAVEYCLHTHKLTWADLQYGITASGRIPGDEIRAAIDTMDAAWEGVALNNPHDRPAKRAINSMVGTFGMKPGGVQIKSWMSYVDEGVLHQGKERLFTQTAFGVPGLRQQVTVAETRDPSTYRPIYDLCLCTEHVRLAQCHQAIQAVAKIQRLPPQFIAVTVDGIIWAKPRKSVSADAMKDILVGMTFEQLPNLEAYLRDQLNRPEPQQKRLRPAELYPLTCTRATAEPVVRVEHPMAKQHLRGAYDPKKCSRDWRFEPPNDDWNDLTIEEAITQVTAGRSIFVRGIAGTGKSHLIRETLIPALRAQGKRVIALAKTHAAAAVADGDTADHFAWKHVREGGTGVDVIWVDEVSMLDIELLCDLSHVSFRDPAPQWILSGDFNQYEPFFNAFRGKPFTKQFEHSALLRLLAGRNRLTLTDCRRGDRPLFEFYASLIAGGSRYDRPLADVVAEARQLYHPTKAKGFIPGTALAPTNLVLSHRLRVELNTRCNQADAQGRDGVERFDLLDYYSEEEVARHGSGTNQPQDALFWPGMLVEARCNGRKLKNALPYEIVAFEGDSVRLKLAVATTDADDESTTATEVTLSRRKFFTSMRLRYARTYASIQGLTISGLMALHDTGHAHFDLCKLFVGTSRAVASDLLVVY